MTRFSLPIFTFFTMFLITLKVSQLLLKVLNKLFIFCAPVFDFLKLSWINFQVLKHHRFDVCIIFLHNVFVSQVFIDFVYPLCVGICNFTTLLTIAQRDCVAPLFLVEFQVKVKDVERMDHVDEGKTYVAFCLEVHR